MVKRWDALKVSAVSAAVATITIVAASLMPKPAVSTALTEFKSQHIDLLSKAELVCNPDTTEPIGLFAGKKSLKGLFRIVSLIGDIDQKDLPPPQVSWPIRENSQWSDVITVRGTSESQLESQKEVYFYPTVHIRLPKEYAGRTVNLHLIGSVEYPAILNGKSDYTIMTNKVSKILRIYIAANHTEQSIIKTFHSLSTKDAEKSTILTLLPFLILIPGLIASMVAIISLIVFLASLKG